MTGRLAYHRRCLREWQTRFGAFAGARKWLGLQAQRLTRRNPVTVSVPGLSQAVHLRSNGSDFACFEQIVLREELAFDVPPNVDLIVDAGANIGLASLVLARRFPHATVIALEVDAANFAMLERNLRDVPNVIALNKALWHEEGFVKIENPDAAAWSFRVVAARRDDPQSIPATDIRALLRLSHRSRVSLLKMDIEGAEFEMFSSSRTWLPDVQMLAVEIHERIRPGVTQLFESSIRPSATSSTRRGEYQILSFA